MNIIQTVCFFVLIFIIYGFILVPIGLEVHYRFLKLKRGEKEVRTAYEIEANINYDVKKVILDLQKKTEKLRKKYIQYRFSYVFKAINELEELIPKEAKE